MGSAIPLRGHRTCHGIEAGADPRQRFDDRRGRWSDASTRGHFSHGPSDNRAANRARASPVSNADVTEPQSPSLLPMEARPQICRIIRAAIALAFVDRLAHGA
jgi:hypothetical protein